MEKASDNTKEAPLLLLCVANGAALSLWYFALGWFFVLWFPCLGKHHPQCTTRDTVVMPIILCFTLASAMTLLFDEDTWESLTDNGVLMLFFAAPVRYGVSMKNMHSPNRQGEILVGQCGIIGLWTVVMVSMISPENLRLVSELILWVVPMFYLLSYLDWKRILFYLMSHAGKDALISKMVKTSIGAALVILLIKFLFPEAPDTDDIMDRVPALRHIERTETLSTAHEHSIMDRVPALRHIERTDTLSTADEFVKRMTESADRMEREIEALKTKNQELVDGVHKIDSESKTVLDILAYIGFPLGVLGLAITVFFGCRGDCRSHPPDWTSLQNWWMRVRVQVQLFREAVHLFFQNCGFFINDSATALWNCATSLLERFCHSLFEREHQEQQEPVEMTTDQEQERPQESTSNQGELERAFDGCLCP